MRTKMLKHKFSGSKLVIAHLSNWMRSLLCLNRCDIYLVKSGVEQEELASAISRDTPEFTTSSNDCNIRMVLFYVLVFGEYKREF